MKILLFETILVVSLMLLLGCGATPYQSAPLKPFPLETTAFRYSYEPKSVAEPRSVSVVIAVVNPKYRETDSALMNKAFKNVGRGFSASMGVDMDKALVAKGMTTLGPYATLDDIVYSSKKSASLALAPTLFITLNSEYIGDWTLYKGRSATRSIEYRMGRNFKLTISGWISLILSEPLSGEKMWVKRLELETREMQGIEYRNALEQYQNTYGIFGEYTGKALSHYSVGENILFDGKIDAVGNYLEQVYPQLMEKFWVYMDPEELHQLKEVSAEIRELKRY